MVFSGDFKSQLVSRVRASPGDLDALFEGRSRGDLVCSNDVSCQPNVDCEFLRFAHRGLGCSGEEQLKKVHVKAFKSQELSSRRSQMLQKVHRSRSL